MIRRDTPTIRECQLFLSNFLEADFWPGTVSGCAVTRAQSPKCQERPYHRLYDGIWLKYWDGMMFLEV